MRSGRVHLPACLALLELAGREVFPSSTAAGGTLRGQWAKPLPSPTLPTHRCHLCVPDDDLIAKRERERGTILQNQNCYITSCFFNADSGLMALYGMPKEEEEVGSLKQRRPVIGPIGGAVVYYSHCSGVRRYELTVPCEAAPLRPRRVCLFQLAVGGAGDPCGSHRNETLTAC